MRGVRGCQTQGRTVEEARRRIVKALELFVDNARKATLVDEVKLTPGAARAVRACASLRKKGEQEAGARPWRLDARCGCYEAGD